jgi:Rrf2 family protein
MNVQREGIFMQFNITTDYAIRTVLYLSIRKQLATASEISQDVGIPKNYQLRVNRPLVKEGILKRVQGSKGGFCLTKDSGKITLYDIANAMGSTIQIKSCLKGECDNDRFVEVEESVQTFYETMKRDIDKYLKNMTIAQLRENIQINKMEKNKGKDKIGMCK